jgi:hypothetical protein
MTRINEAARVAGLAALHADSEWHRSDGTGVWRANYARAVDLVLEAALPHLEGATPAIDREALLVRFEDLLREHKAFERMPMSNKQLDADLTALATALVGLIGGASK